MRVVRKRRIGSEPTGRWLASELVEEAWRRTATPWMIWVVVVGTLAALVAISSVQSIRAAVDAQRDRENAGASVLVTTVADGETLSAAACADLAHNGAVLAAGAVFGEVTNEPVTWEPSHLDIPTYDVTLGALRAWQHDAPAEGGLMVGRDLSTTLGVAPAARVSINGSPAYVSSILSAKVRPAQLQASVIRVRAAIGDAQECWVRTRPGVTSKIKDVMSASFPENRTITTTFARPDELSVDPEIILDKSPLRWGWVAALGLTMLVSAILAIVERSEYGIYRATGSARGDMLLMRQVQDLIACLCAFAAALGCGVLTLALAGVEPDLATLWYFIQPTALFCLSVLIISPGVHHLLSGSAQVDTMRAA